MIRRTNDEWRTLFAEHSASGQTMEDWCAAKGINYITMNDRGYRLKRMDKKSKQKPQHKELNATSSVWIEVKAERLPKQTADISIACGGFTVTVTAGYDAGMLTETLRAVSRACC